MLMVHLIFVTKYRKAILTGSFKKDVKKYLSDTCHRYHWYIKRMETDKDHIHILLQFNPKDSIFTIVSYLKQHSTYLAWQNYEIMLQQKYWKEKTLWSDGYFAATVGTVSQKAIEHYIETQG